MESTTDNKNNQLSLRWNGFTENIISSLELSLGNQDFVDVTLVCEEGTIKAHRLILSASSSFFQRVLKENTCPHPVIVLKGITFSEMKTLLMFIYHGEARTSEENIPRLLEAAAFLEITGLSPQEYSQVPLQPMIPGEMMEVNRSDIDNDFIHSEVHSTAQETSDLFYQAETYSTQIKFARKIVDNDIGERLGGGIDQNIKQEPVDEESMTQRVRDEESGCGQAVPRLVRVFSKTKQQDKSSHSLPKADFSVQEMLVLQQQRKLAFYEPRPCPKCHRVYRDAATLRNHIASMHELLRHGIACCGTVFPTKHDLYVHRRKDHKGTAA